MEVVHGYQWFFKRRPQATMPFRVAVYGTLRKNSFNHDLIHRAGGVFVGKGTVEANMYVCGCPVVYLHPGSNSKVVVEVYDLHLIEGVARIERLEGGYHRDETTVTLDNGDQIKAWIYTGDMEDFEGHGYSTLSETGDYLIDMGEDDHYMRRRRERRKYGYEFNFRDM